MVSSAIIRAIHAGIKKKLWHLASVLLQPHVHTIGRLGLYMSGPCCNLHRARTRPSTSGNFLHELGCKASLVMNTMPAAFRTHPGNSHAHPLNGCATEFAGITKVTRFHERRHAEEQPLSLHRVPAPPYAEMTCFLCLASLCALMSFSTSNLTLVQSWLAHCLPCHVARLVGPPTALESEPPSVQSDGCKNEGSVRFKSDPSTHRPGDDSAIEATLCQAQGLAQVTIRFKRRGSRNEHTGTGRSEKR